MGFFSFKYNKIAFVSSAKIKKSLSGGKGRIRIENQKSKIRSVIVHTDLTFLIK
jgi:hypothetical protein